jgi:hypothetical protein
MEPALKTPVAMGAALLVVVALGALHSGPADGAAGLRADGLAGPLPAQACLAGCAAPPGGACAQAVVSTALYERHNTNECVAFEMR